MKIANWFKARKKSQFVFVHNKKTKIGLALGGGGTRGFAHIGALKAFEEYGIKFDYVAGTSVGSLVGALYAEGKTYSDIYQIAKNLKIKDIKKNKIIFMPSTTEGIENIVSQNISAKNIEDLKIPFSAVTCDLKSTKEVIFTKGDLAKAVAGSCAVPGIFQPVEYADFLLTDGGLQDTIPAVVPKLFGCDYVVAIDVNPARGYGTDSPKVIDVLTCSIRILMKNTALKGYLNADVLLKPDTKRFKSTKVDDMDEIIDEGYREAIEKMPAILKLFGYNPLKKKQKAKIFDDKVVVN